MTNPSTLNVADLDELIDETLEQLSTLADLSGSTMHEALAVAAQRWEEFADALNSGADDKAHRLHPGYWKMALVDEEDSPENAEDAIDNLIVLFDSFVVHADALAAEVVEMVSEAVDKHSAAQR